MNKIAAFLSFLFFICFNAFTQKITLDYFINQGFQHSPLLKDYQNQLNSAALDSLLIKSGQKAAMDINAQVLVAPYSDQFGYDPAITNGGNYSALIGVHKSFFNKKTLQTRYSSIEIQNRAIKNNSRISENDLKKNITNQYLGAYNDYLELTFNQSLLKIINEEENILKQLTNQGLYKQTDYLSFLIEKQSKEILIKQLKALYLKDLFSLDLLCGIYDTNFYIPEYPQIENKNRTDFTFSPLFMQFKIDSLKNLNDRAVINDNYRPRLSWIADAGILSSQPQTAYQHFGFSAGVNFSIPLYNGKQKLLEFKKIDLAESTRLEYKNYFTRSFRQQIMIFRHDLASTKDQAEDLKIQLKTAEELIHLINLQLNAGNVSITELILALKNYVTINKNMNQAQIKELQIINEMNYWMQ